MGARKLAEAVDAVGTLRARQSTVVRAEVGGRITQIFFGDGRQVTKGQPLVQLDDRLQQAQVQQAKAELSIAQNNHRRNTELVAKGFISQRAVDESAAALQVAQAKADLARTAAERLRVLAPFDGVAGLRNISVGDYLKEGADIVNLEDMTAMYVDFRLPERLQARVRPGQSARVQVDALPGRAFPAVVTALDPVIDANGRSLVVRGCIDNRLHHLRSGMFAKVMTRLGDERVALMVPEEAVVSQGGRQSVIRLLKADGAGSEAAWTTQRVDVQTGARQDGLVEVVRQLAEGDQVVVAGQQRVQRDGQTVRVAAPAVSGAQAEASAAALATQPMDGKPVPSPAAENQAGASQVSAPVSGVAALPLAASAPGQNPCAALIAAPRR